MFDATHDAYFLSHLPGYETFGGTHGHMMKALADERVPSEVVKYFYGVDGKPMIELRRVIAKDGAVVAARVAAGK